MRELSVASRAPSRGRPTSPTSSSLTRPAAHITRRCAGASTALARHHSGAICRRGQRRRPRSDRRGHRARRPRRADVQNPLRMDAVRFRGAGNRCSRRADLRDLQCRAGRVDPRRFRGQGAGRRDRRARGDRRLDTLSRSRAGARLADRGRRSGLPHRAGGRGAGRRGDQARVRPPPSTTWRRSSTPRAPPAVQRAASSRIATSSPRSPRASSPRCGCSSPTARRPCCSSRWRTFSAASSKSARWRPAVRWATPPTSRTW